MTQNDRMVVSFRLRGCSTSSFVKMSLSDRKCKRGDFEPPPIPQLCGVPLYPFEAGHVGRLTKLVHASRRCVDHGALRVYVLRLTFSECIFGRSRRFHRIRHENLHRSIKKNIKKDWLDKKLEQLKVEPWKFLRSKIFEKFRSQKISFSYNFQWKFLKIWDRKFSKFFDLKIFHFHWIFNENFEKFRKISISKFFKFSTLSCSNFLSNQYFLIIFFYGSM